MADDKRDDDKHKAEKKEDLTPTPTQEENDKAALGGKEPEKREAKKTPEGSDADADPGRNG